MKIYICHSSDYDYETMLYSPIRNSNIYVNHEVILPHDNKTDIINSKDIIKDTDLVIAEVSLKSTGMGIELGWAESFGKEILCLCSSSQNYTKSLECVSNKFIIYSSIEDMIYKIEEYLKLIKI